MELVPDSEEPLISGNQLRGIRAMCDHKRWPIPDDLPDWTKARASEWMEERDFRGWRDTHPRAA
jgi:hypothetical protein